MTNVRPLNIFGRAVGPGEDTFVIAEIGVNHDGSVERALDLVQAAAAARADAVKLQIFSADRLMHGSGTFATYQKKRCDEKSPAEMLRKYELSPGDLERVIDAIRERGMVPLATPFSLDDVQTIGDLKLPAVKVASPDLVNRPLLLAAAALGKPLLISTGAATLDEIDRTVGWLSARAAPFALLHCVSSYPTPNHDANLCWIGELAARIHAPIGYSDHTTEILSGALAVAAGACIVEKHLTYDRAATGPDHAASADPQQFTDYVRQVRLAQRLRGRPGKRVLESEFDVRRVSRQSLVLARELHPGDVLRGDDLIVQRPGTGIPAASIDQAVGRKILRPLEAGTLLQWDMLSDAA
jgi:sialic acid synthase SpsE